MSTESPPTSEGSASSRNGRQRAAQGHGGTRQRFGAVRKLPSGRWQARYTASDGRKRTAPDTFPNKTDAQRWLSSVETDMSRGMWLDPQRAEVRLSSYATGWLSQRTAKGRPLAPRTIDTYWHSLDAWILPTLGSLPLAKLTPDMVRTWHAEVSRQTGPTACRQAYALLRAILTTAVDDGALPRNPCRVKGAGQACSPERPLLDVEAVEALAGEMPEHLRALTLLAMWAGLRIGELLALRRGDLDVGAGTVRIERQQVEVSRSDGGPGKLPVETEPKVGSRRTVHLPRQVLFALSEHLDRIGPGLPTGRLFTRPDGSPLRYAHVENAWRSARLRAGYPTVHLHDLRHAGLTLAAQSGATLAEVMRRAGHVSTRAALLYQHAAERRDVELAERLSALPSASLLRVASGTPVARGDQQIK